jgi:hypothetical protein
MTRTHADDAKALRELRELVHELPTNKRSCKDALQHAIEAIRERAELLRLMHKTRGKAP